MGTVLVLALNLLLPAAVQGDGERPQTVTGFHLQASTGYGFFALAGAPPKG
jgi:hypothetical protein